jgi:regulator of sigma E protease
LVLAILALGFLIIVHEAGHYVVARWCGMRVERFSIGFGPGILKRRSKKSGTLFQIAPIPFGGFVEIRGMNIAEEVDPEDRSAYPNRPAWQRFVTIFAGPATNYVSAVVLAFGFYACVGMKSVERYYDVDLVDEAYDAKGKLQPDDRILSIDGVKVYARSPDGKEISVSERINAAGGKPVVVRVQRDGKELDVTVTPTGTTQFLAVPMKETTVYRIGVGLVIRYARVEVGLGEAAIGAIRYPVDTTVTILRGLKKVITGEEPLQAQGPVGITQEFKKAFDEGLTMGIQLLMVLSVYIGLFNLLPLPALDGGRLVFLTYELVTRRRANPRIETTVHMVGILILLVLMVMLTFGEVRGCIVNPG